LSWSFLGNANDRGPGEVIVLAASQSARSGDAHGQSPSQHGEKTRDTESTTVNLLFAQFRLPTARFPGREDLADAVTRVREWLPPAEQLAYYGGWEHWRCSR
jgi:hypothetical protein